MTYNRINCSERLPDESGYYLTNDGEKYFYHNGQEFIEWDDSPAGMVEYWLEAIQLSIDEEIEKIVKEMNDDGYTWLETRIWRSGFKSCLELLTNKK